MDPIHINSTDEECIEDNKVPKISTEQPQSQQAFNTSPALVWNVMAKTNDCSDNLHNTGETTDAIKLPEEPVKCSPPEQNDGHFRENCPESTVIPSAPCETTLTKYQVAHSNANTSHSSQKDFPQASSSMQAPIQWTSQHHCRSAGLSSQHHCMGPFSSSGQQCMTAGPSSQDHCMTAGPSSQQLYMGVHPSSQQLYMSALSSSQQHYGPCLPTSQQPNMSPFPPWHSNEHRYSAPQPVSPFPPWHSNAHRYSAPQPVAGWELMPPPGPSGLQTKGTTAQPAKRPGININIRVGKCDHDAGTTEKFSTCGICCCLLFPIIGCIFCMKSKDVVCAKCDKVIGKASREKKIEQGKCAHDGGTQEKFSKCGVCCCLLLPIIGCIFCSSNKNLVCVKCDKVVGKVSKEKVKNIEEECEKSKEVPRKHQKVKKRKQILSPNKDKKKLIRKASLKKNTNREGEVRKRPKINVENPREQINLKEQAQA